jgi:hypothetical protein
MALGACRTERSDQLGQRAILPERPLANPMLLRMAVPAKGNRVPIVWLLTDSGTAPDADMGNLDSGHRSASTTGV